ncbi:PREDICTED: uncharacterized protein LOC108555056 [Eufriesea mexicana]|uniref:uncharacterized protein LOC108555056 n=1 Tax=Eufriesea mexicana TaxID=516756 RepID=UPI00083C0E82|nr:PREDICTED: uncharacterized protein LOC108555056 [Eufriesea mexicana]
MTGWRMRPTASALGVIAIVSVMITATPSEADSGAISEPSINHPEVDEEERRVLEDEKSSNRSIVDDLTAVTLRTRVDDTASEGPGTEASRMVTTDHGNLANVSRMENEIVDEPQRDQSDALSVAVAPNDVLELEVGQAERNSAENRVRHASKTLMASTRPDRADMASSIGPVEAPMPGSRDEDDLDDVQVDDEAISNVVWKIDGSGANKALRDESVGFTTASIRWTIVTEVRPIEQKKQEDIKAISFQVPAAAVKATKDGDEQQQQQQERNVSQPKKDHSRPVNNLLLTGDKSTKVFYEIKPSIKTEMEGDPSTSSTPKPLLGRKFVLPSVDSAFGKFGPYFEKDDQEMNITARIGTTILLDCEIGMLRNKEEVTWLQQPSKDSFRLLTVGMVPYSVDQRISLNFRYPNNWRLQILYATPRDSGIYKCQVGTHPPLVKTINVIVTAPELTITDDSGRVVSKERHLKAGSALKLRCEARDVIESLEESVIWTRGDETLIEDVSENRTTEMLAGKEVLVIVSTLIVERASPRHAGNYSCVVPGKAKTTIAVHVLNGELPAAVHDGNGVSRAFLNLWLIHLTMSYVFSR